MVTEVAAPEAVNKTLGTQVSRGWQLLAFIEVLLLGVWLGSMMFFSFGVAPSAFAVLPTRELAGVMVTSAIGKLEILGMDLGILLVAIHTANLRRRKANRLGVLHALLLLVMIGAAALSRFWISPAMVSLRAQMGGRIDDVAITDPLRVQFNDLHQYSVGLMSAAMICGLIVLFLTVRSWLTQNTSR
jgi:hypothetical protein